MNSRKNIKVIARIVLCFTVLMAISPFIFSQSDSIYRGINLGYKDYMKMVVSRNLEYMTEKYNVSIADAGIEAARVYQNPTVAFDWTRIKEDNSNSLSAEISKTFETGQKRKARINLAKSGSLVANAMLGDYVRNLLADATIDYLSALKQNYLFKVMLSSYRMMKELSDADSVRLSLGSIKSIDAIQSKIEAGILLNDLFQIDAERKNSFITLSTRTSTYHEDTLYFPEGKFDKFERPFILSELLTKAIDNRADLLVAKNNIAYQQNLLKWTKSERRTDIDIKAGTSGTYLKTGISSPVGSEIYAGIAVPLKFSNLNKGEIKIVQFQVEQGELLYQQAEIKIRNEVIQAYYQYRSLCAQVENYNQGLLEQAKTVLNGKIYSYSRGETSLLEVLNAQRTYNDLQTSYYETLYNCCAALVELERAVGSYDIEL